MTKPLAFRCIRSGDDWIVRGPKPFKMLVPDKRLGEPIAAMFNGDWDRARKLMDSVAFWDGEVVTLSHGTLADLTAAVQRVRSA